MALFLLAYLTSGIYTELRLIERKPLPRSLLRDFTHYQRAYEAAVAGLDPYSIREIGPGFLYPPPALLLVAPFAHIPDRLVQAVVYDLTNVTLSIIMTWGVARFYGYTIRQVWFWLPLVLGFAPFLELLHIGQINTIVQFGIFVLFFFETTWPVIAGIGLGLASLIKVTPLLFVGYLLVNKRLKVLAAALVTAVAVSALALWRYGAEPFVTYIDVFRNLLNEFPLGGNSQSLAAKLAFNASRFAASATFLPPILESAVSNLASFFMSNVAGVQRTITAYIAAVLLISGGITLRVRQREPFFLITSLSMTLSPNIMWYHHYVFLLLPVLVWMGWRHLQGRVLVWCLGGLLLIQIDRVHLTYGLLIQLWGHVSMWLILYWQIKQWSVSFRKRAILSETQV